MIEEWKPVPIDEYKEIYEVSNFGRVRSVDRYVNCNGGKKFHKGKILKPAINKCGYQHISLSCNQKLHTFRVCRLVAKAFVPNPNNLPCVNHKDEDIPTLNGAIICTTTIMGLVMSVLLSHKVVFINHLAKHIMKQGKNLLCVLTQERSTNLYQKFKELQVINILIFQPPAEAN